MELNELVFKEEIVNEKINLEIKNKISFNKNKVFIDKKIILENISIELKLGDVYCIIGENGSGKSTFLKFILGLYIHDNKVIIDNKEYNLYETDIEKSIGYCPSKPYYFAGTIFENIKDSQDSISDVIETTKKFGLHEYFLKFEDGYETKMNNQMDNSVLQIVNLMKALNKKSKIILLDESFVYIDLNIALFIIDILIKNLDNKLILVILHDKILKKFNSKLEVIDKNIFIK